jgi:hypothetical protein
MIQRFGSDLMYQAKSAGRGALDAGAQSVAAAVRRRKFPDPQRPDAATYYGDGLFACAGPHVVWRGDGKPGEVAHAD